jgi:YcxB-like protein
MPPNKALEGDALEARASAQTLAIKVMEHQVKLQYDSALLREALLGFWWRTVTGRWLIALVICVAGFIYFWVSGDRSWLIGAFGAVLLFGVGMIMAVYFVHSANMKRKFKDMGVPEATFTASESSFSVASGAGSSTMPWSSVTDVWKFKRCWLLLFSKAQFITVPLAGVPEEMRAFILQRVAAAGGKTDG